MSAYPGQAYPGQAHPGEVATSDVTGRVGATIGSFTGSVTGIVTATGQVAANIPELTAAVAGTAPVTSVGAVAGAIQAEASVTGVVASIIGGAVAATIPALAAAVVGAVTVPDAPYGSGLPLGSSSQAALRGSVLLPFSVAESGSATASFAAANSTPMIVAPPVAGGAASARSVWYALNSTDTQTLTVTATGGTWVEVWSVDLNDTVDTMSLLDAALAGVSVAVAGGQALLIRVHPASASETGSATVTWSTATRTATGNLSFYLASEILETPGWLPYAVTSADEEAQLDFFLDGTTTALTADDTDESGTVSAGTISLPDLSAGNHTITVRDSITGQEQTRTFKVLLDVLGDDPIIPDSSPRTGVSPDPVIHWVLEDPAPDGEVYEFPINPSKASSPHPERAITIEHTLHPSGGVVTWEGRPAPVDWQVQGSVRTQEHYAALVRFYGRQRRLFLIDHHQRVWVVSMEGLDMVEMKSAYNDWAYSYTLKMRIYDGPLELS